ncbi:molybdenum cofactor guanylyltransferase MobA [Kiloniella laminariae]|uniref:Molybdenum cofactor guanylyltransferase n=1 Tax=Kiloniella laminariae TaxID=454162 RepID=A0ABT4LHK0_9PROT|nr:molybdenum cofactor guanylyltransferase MobA [Kiloniella laminariae]MCZ4280568.1 molybdenum cofactor guanylyltransferase MobA [Kiloniella laminariae]
MSTLVRQHDVAGVILAGGLARRMGGGDKSLKLLAGQTLLQRVLGRIIPQVGPLLINANGDPARFAEHHLPVAVDVLEGHPGPLAGILTAMEWFAEHHPDIKWLVSVPCDAPLIPQDLVKRLKSAAEQEKLPLACAVSRGRSHPVVGLWSVHLRADLRQALVEDEVRKVDLWTARHGIAEAVFADLEIAGQKLDPFFNANKPGDLTEVEAFLLT